ncbi:MAG: hypothetical protein LIP01_03060 [Tannerellaceae bacterium]|nr:hypothetical protein [Tannerellaceae bacterium]
MKKVSPPHDQTGILENSIFLTKEIRLKHNQNNISLEYSTNNYVNPLQKTIYEYTLEGFENKWYKTENQEITYTNLNPGKYILRIREITDDPFLKQELSLFIKISSPIYATPFFYFLYLLITLTLIGSFYRFKRSQLLLQTSLEIERKEKEKIEEINQAKLQFFSNISHEFQTPLTLIISQMEILLQSSNLSPTIYNKLLKVYKNTYHLRTLISELLNFRKLEQGHVKLKVYEQDITPFLKEIFYSFF